MTKRVPHAARSANVPSELWVVTQLEGLPPARNPPVATRSPRTLKCSIVQERAEPLERPGPALGHAAVALVEHLLLGRRRLVRRPADRDERLAAEVLEADIRGQLRRPLGGQRMAAETAVLVRERADEHEPLGRDDLLEDPLAPHLDAGALHQMVVQAAGTQVECGVGGLEPTGTEPSPELLGLGPRLPDALARRLHEPGDHELSGQVGGQARERLLAALDRAVLAHDLVARGRGVEHHPQRELGLAVLLDERDRRAEMDAGATLAP